MVEANVLFGDKIEHLDPKVLVPAGYNPRPRLRSSNPAKFARLKRSLDLGVFKPILVNRRTGHIVAGHQRVDAAIDMKWPTVPVLFIDVDERDEKRINIADNSEWSAFEKEMLQKVIVEDGFDSDELEIFGFDDDEIEMLTQDLGSSESEDDAPDMKADSGLETLRLILTTEQNEEVLEILDFVKERTNVKNPDNPNANGNAAYFVFAAFRADHIRRTPAPVRDDFETSEADS